MDDRAPADDGRRLRRTLWGSALMLLGALMLGFLVFVSNSQGAERLMMSLGLAASAILSATGQFLMLLGAWMVWKATRRRSR